MPDAPPPLSRERFVENALWIGLAIACQGNDQDNLEFRGDFNDGAVDCNDGQGSDFLALWGPSGVLVLAHDHYQYERVLPPIPPELHCLVERVSPTRMEQATGGLWISRDGSTSTLSRAERGSVLSIIENMCGPSLLAAADVRAPERILLDAMARGAGAITAEIARILLRQKTIERLMEYQQRSALDATRSFAKSLGRFGLQWHDLEIHVAEKWPARG